jgi:hypothetical protein
MVSGRGSWAGHAADIDKENVAPLFLDLNRYPTAGQQVVSIPPPPVSVTAAYPDQFDPTIMSGLPPIQTVLLMTLRGQPISFDLHTLEDDPRLIIELLIATSSDRDKWMIAGAFYRRKGNIHAALTVVTTMVKGQREQIPCFSYFSERYYLVLNDQGIRECDMKPAFLMLSSCHVELWRQTRSTDGSETEISAAHLDKSCRWLQLVYGQGNPEVMSGERLEVFDTLSSVDTMSSQAPSIPFAGEPITFDKRRRTDLERDLQVMLDRQALQLQELAHTRDAKRRLEDEATDERATRRRLERTLHNLETKLAKAQRRVGDVQALVRMEANARRRSEQVVTEERAKRRALEEHLKSQAQSARPLLEELAGLFQRAGPQGKIDAVMSPAPGGSLRRFNKASNRDG